MRAAIYARVSTEKQERDQTIDSQLTSLREWVARQGHDLRPEHVFTDPGHSGARLDRPGLDRLRDAAAAAEFDVIAVYSPDRLARRYAYQVVLLEEFRKAGCAVAFVQRPISADPHDQLLLQIQGAVAEYERAVLGERFRRGKIQRARAGAWVAGRAPYGYRYVPKRDGVPGHLVVDDAEAAVVRMMYHWLIDDRLSIRAIIRRLTDGPWRPRRGGRVWSNPVVHRILSDPVYAGTGYANRYVLTASPHPHRRSRRPDALTCRRERPREEWIPIPVPALIDEETHELAAAQFAHNAAVAARHNTRHFYLLRCLLTCRRCGRAMVGVSYPDGGRGRHRYYKCCGREPISPEHQPRCTRPMVRAEDLDEAVWGHIRRLLDDPGTLASQFEAIARRSEDPTAAREESKRWASQLNRLDREEVRLVDAYQAEILSLAELKERREKVQDRRRVLTSQRDQQAKLRDERLAVQAVWKDLSFFCEQISNRLSEVVGEEKQRVLQLLVERVIVGDEALEIRHLIPLRAVREEATRLAPRGDASGVPDAGGVSPGQPDVRLRSDRVPVPWLLEAVRRPDRDHLRRAPPTAPGLDLVPLLHGAEPLQRADRPGTRPGPGRCPGDDDSTAGGHRPTKARGEAQRRSRVR
jgi:site-specific DNA recombinase